MTPTLVTTRKNEKRSDIIITYIDGEAKSGQYYASRYAEENKISTGCVISPVDFHSRVNKFEKEKGTTINGIVIVDDIIATGGTMSVAIDVFVKENAKFMEERSIHLMILALYGVKKGVQAVDRKLASLSYKDIDLQIMEPLSEEHFAFLETPGIWASPEDFDKAKAICINLGSKIYPKNPLGWGGLGLMLVFPTTCPNNSLPLLHSHSTGDQPWTPLFPRPVN